MTKGAVVNIAVGTRDEASVFKPGSDKGGAVSGGGLVGPEYLLDELVLEEAAEVDE